MAPNFALRPFAVIASTLIATGSALAAAPTPDKVFEENAKAMGGEAAIRAIKTRFYDGTMENKRAKMVSRITSWQQAPDKTYTEIETLGVGTFTQSFDGTEAWTLDGHGVLKTLEGTEAGSVADAALLAGDLDWKTRYSEARTVGETTFESKPAIEIAVVSKGGPRSLFFDPKTWMQLGVKESVPGPKGPDGKPTKQQLTTTFDEYRDIGGVKTVVKFTQKVGDFEIVSAFKTVEPNVDVKVNFAKPKTVAKAPDTAAPAAAPAAKTETKDSKK